MDLFTRRSALLRDKLVMRFSVVLLTISLLVGSLVYPPKAEAFVGTAAVVTIASCFLASCGITWLVDGMDSTGFNTAVGGMVQDYLDTELGGQSMQDWCGDLAVSSAGGKLLLPKLLAEKLGAFASWVVEKYTLTAGGSDVTVQANRPSLLCADGSTFNFAIYNNTTAKWDGYGTCLEPGTDLILASGAKFVWSGLKLRFYLSDGTLYPYSHSYYTFEDHNGSDYSIHERAVLMYSVTTNTFSLCSQWVKNDYSILYDPSFDCFGNAGLSLLGDLANAGSLSLAPAQAIGIPGVGSMTEDEQLAIDTGITAGTLAELLERINKALLANELAVTQEVVKEEVKPGEITDVNELGLPALGVIITTRFPFSIPWDVVRGIKLIAAPPKTPHWEVDFYGAVEGMVPGGWKGDTSIVIDFSKFEVLGQLCRWTSTIGFCLFLAMGTKKLSWVS